MTLAHVLMSILLCLVFGLAASRSWVGNGECIVPLPWPNQRGYVEKRPCPDCNGAGELEVVDPAPEVVDLLAEVRRLCR